MAEIQLKDIMVGDECEAARSNLEINYPIDNGKVTDWDDMCKLWDHAFYDQLLVSLDYPPAFHRSTGTRRMTPFRWLGRWTRRRRRSS